MAGKQLGRPTSKENWVKKNAVLMELGSNFRIRLTSQSPVFYVKAICPFPDGSDRKSTGVYSTEPGTVDRVFKLCLHLDDNPNALVEQKRMLRNPVTQWRALSLGWRRTYGNSKSRTRIPTTQALQITAAARSRQSTGYDSGENHPKTQRRTRRLVTCNRLVRR